MEQNARCVPAGLTRSLACHGGRACLGEPSVDGSRRIIEKPEAPQGRRRKPWRKRKTQNSQVWDFVHEQRASVFHLRHPVMPQNKKRTERDVEIRQTCIGCFHARARSFPVEMVFMAGYGRATGAGGKEKAAGASPCRLQAGNTWLHGNCPKRRLNPWCFRGRMRVRYDPAGAQRRNQPD